MSDVPEKPALVDVPPMPSVVRSPVPAGLRYPEYRKYLRYDFFHSCAYCTLTEYEAQTIRFTIDHYVPQEKAPNLVNDYSNLLWSCDPCNSRKKDRYPTDAVQAQGYRLFRPDLDIRAEHFGITGIRLEPRTKIGSYTVDLLALNRKTLLTVRDLRNRVTKSTEFIAEGITALRRFRLDDVPADIRARALRFIGDVVEQRKLVEGRIDDWLRSYARSDLLSDDEPSEEEVKDDKERLARLHSLGGLRPGQWQGRNPRKK